MPGGYSLVRLSPLLAAAFFLVLGTPALAQSSTTAGKRGHAPSAADCAARADRAAMDSRGVAGGAVRGGVGGAAFGAIVGGGKGARRGAALGAVVGGARGGAQRNDVYRRVYDDCMAGY